MGMYVLEPISYLAHSEGNILGTVFSHFFEINFTEVRFGKCIF